MSRNTNTFTVKNNTSREARNHAVLYVASEPKATNVLVTIFT